MATVSFTPNVFASRDRGPSWAVVSHHRPPVHVVAFAGDPGESLTRG